MLWLPSAAIATQPVFDFKAIGAEQGLGNSYVLKVIQDRQGFIWVATQNGLYRYDGYQFKAFLHDPEDPTSLAGNYIQHLFEDSDGTLWVGIWHGGFAQYHPQTQTFTRYLHDPKVSNSLSNNEVMAITEDNSGKLWIATLGGGLKNKTHRR